MAIEEVGGPIIYNVDLTTEFMFAAPGNQSTEPGLPNRNIDPTNVHRWVEAAVVHNAVGQVPNPPAQAEQNYYENYYDGVQGHMEDRLTAAVRSCFRGGDCVVQIELPGAEEHGITEGGKVIARCALEGYETFSGALLAEVQCQSLHSQAPARIEDQAGRTVGFLQQALQQQAEANGLVDDALKSL
jgi:hypothetical protein